MWTPESLAFTFCDKLEGDCEQEFLTDFQQGNNCKYGRVAMASRPASRLGEEDEPEEDEREQRYLGELFREQETKVISELAGARNVHSKISEAYSEQVYSRWVPDAADQVLRTWQEQAIKDIALGQPPSPGNLGGEDLEKLREAVKEEVRRRWKDLPEISQVALRFQQSLQESLPQGMQVRASGSWEGYVQECHRVAKKQLEESLQGFVETRHNC